ncbi:adenine-specific methyltransferase EcoRI family protein, partial [Streptococcus dysgalactiae]|uniref:adenine-specific methyltransferase EcoRI family protein n=1 Tax=Streptococcus dysgalactiae TaxID=1334 RepID=UPI0012DD5059
FNFKEKNLINGFYYEYTGEKEETLIPTKDDVIFINGDGDFRSQESIELLKSADVVETNPPFSLFREHIDQIIKYNKEFLVIGNINAITYKNIFNLIQNNDAWMGVNMGRGISGFIVPQHYELYGTETTIDDDGNRIISTNNNLWLTNLDNEKRHTDIILTQTYEGNEDKYPKYDNYDGINVNRTLDIPKDYKGAMGVPITFLHKFNPDQFEIIKFRKGNDNKDLSINGKCPYFRILIRNKSISK